MKTETGRNPLIIAIRHDGHVEAWTGLSPTESRNALAAHAAGDVENDCGLHDYHRHLVIHNLDDLETEIEGAYKNKPHAWVALTTVLEDQRWRFE